MRVYLNNNLTDLDTGCSQKCNFEKLPALKYTFDWGLLAFV